jgi:hypothetical protein
LYQWLERETRIIDRTMRTLKERHASWSLPSSIDCLKSRDEHKRKHQARFSNNAISFGHTMIKVYQRWISP